MQAADSMMEARVLASSSAPTGAQEHTGNERKPPAVESSTVESETPALAAPAFVPEVEAAAVPAVASLNVSFASTSVAGVGYDNLRPEDFVPVVQSRGRDVTNTGAPRPKELIRKWPSTMMRLMNENDDDEWLPVIDRIRTHPDEILIEGKNGGMNSLHAACVRYPPVHVIDAMLECRPEAALRQNFSGESPLHLASYSASEEVQALLVRKAPEAAAMSDQYLDVPLHFAARSGATYPLMEQLTQAAPQCISKQNRRGVTPFWLLPRSYLEAEDLEEIWDEEAEDYRDDWDLMVLFLKYSYQEMSEQELPTFRRDPNTDLEGAEPLPQYDWLCHAAASTPSCPREVLRFLCRMFPDQALRGNSKGFTPLLLACQVPEMEEPKDWDENEDGFREHVEVSEGELHNEDQEVPEEQVALDSGDTDFLNQTIQAVAEEEEVSESVVDMLLEWSPRSAFYADRQGRLPLAHALLSGRSWKVIRRLIAACPRALQCRDLASGLYMFQLAAMNSPDLDTVYTMVRSLPELLGMARSYATVSSDLPQCKRARAGGIHVPDVDSPFDHCTQCASHASP